MAQVKVSANPIITSFLCWLKNKAKRTDARLQRFSNSLQHIEEATQNASQNYIVLFYSRYVIL